MGEGWQLMRIRGIPLRIHPTWFLILFAATVAFERQYRVSLAGSASQPQIWAVALVTAVLLFVSVLLHELGHSLVAIGQGVKVRSITLFLLGGVATVEKECPTAIGALLVALAGPAVSLLLGVGLLAGVHGASHHSSLIGEMLTQLGVLNLVLALFNLLPGLPLDGGLVVKALVWQITGSRRRGLEVANGCGRFLSFLAIGLGSVLLLRGGGLSGAWLLLLGWFGLGAARNQGQMLLVQQALRELRVKDAARRRFRVVEADTSLRRLSQLASTPVPSAGRAEGSTAAGPPDWVLVCDRGRWRGVADEAILQQLPVQRWDQETVAGHLQPLSTLPAIQESAPLWQAVTALEESAQGRLLVLGPAGLPSGTIERPELGEAVLQRIGLRLPPQLLSTARSQGTYPLGLALPQVTRAMQAAGDLDTDPQPAQARSVGAGSDPGSNGSGPGPRA
ncbi:MAG: site-2 protease family protein [Cyanobacteriota bacterium]|nr:site-2 protease family protein [Cyanobacteriota bacterium]